MAANNSAVANGITALDAIRDAIAGETLATATPRHRLTPIPGTP